MTQCNYIYASGLRIKEGDGVVHLGGKVLMVVRDGSGQSRPDLPLADDFLDGTITLSDLGKRLSDMGKESLRLYVCARNARRVDQEFFVDIDPAAAMGRQGREGDFRGAVAAMEPYHRVRAAVYQLSTLPYSNKQSGSETSDRLRFAIEEAGGFMEAHRYLDERFSLHADQGLLDETLAWVAKVEYRWAGDAMIRVAGYAIGDPLRVSNEHFQFAVEHLLRSEDIHSTNRSVGPEFINRAFDRLDDDSLKELLYRGLKNDRYRADYLRVITRPDRLRRIEEWGSPESILSHDVRNPQHQHNVEFLSRVARSLSEQLVTPAEPKFTGDPRADGLEWSRRAAPKTVPQSFGAPKPGRTPTGAVWKLPGTF